MLNRAFTILAAAGLAVGQSVSNTATATSDIAAAAATARTESPTSHVKGKAFDRIVQIYLETTAFDSAVNNTDCQALFKKGILLTKEYGVGAPSQPNYISPASGDTFGLNSDSFVVVDKNVSTIVDLLEDKGISWGDYNEGLPYTGFDGFEYSNPVEGNYMRKHNLLIRFDSVTNDPDRLAKIKNLTLFYEDLENERLPQWSFITPNLYNNGHDTNISVSCNWTRSFVEPLLANKYINDNTLFYITWQANGQNATQRNHVAGIQVGSAIPEHLVGTTDDGYFNHYSELSSVEANWDLHTLGRWDVGANVWNLVGRKTGDGIRQWDEKIALGPFESYFWNQSYGGVFSSAPNTTHTYVAPNIHLEHNGRTVLPAIQRKWRNSKCRGLRTYYEDIIELPDEFHPPCGFEVPIGLMPHDPIMTPITVFPAANYSDTTGLAYPSICSSASNLYPTHPPKPDYGNGKDH
ncbi:hypothetical protein JX265_005784 [Neoarthrinium moseri]|uniref:Acid phosphatase n=1 Tax=Neoarthrinium moseri TaxID=1658444 RepID=A0A9P9WNN7_9PEZI|nr:hypothetical protein JX265_005784 [Neoarthrinium moseri]